MVRHPSPYGTTCKWSACACLVLGCKDLELSVQDSRSHCYSQYLSALWPVCTTCTWSVLSVPGKSVPVWCWDIKSWSPASKSHCSSQYYLYLVCTVCTWPVCACLVLGYKELEPSLQVTLLQPVLPYLVCTVCTWPVCACLVLGYKELEPGL
jgi:hypothetical protein